MARMVPAKPVMPWMMLVSRMTMKKRIWFCMLYFPYLARMPSNSPLQAEPFL